MSVHVICIRYSILISTTDCRNSYAVLYSRRQLTHVTLTTEFCSISRKQPLLIIILLLLLLLFPPPSLVPSVHPVLPFPSPPSSAVTIVIVAAAAADNDDYIDH